MSKGFKPLDIFLDNNRKSFYKIANRIGISSGEYPIAYREPMIAPIEVPVI